MKIGNLFYFDVALEDNPSIFKNRPVLMDFKHIGYLVIVGVATAYKIDEKRLK